MARKTILCHFYNEEWILPFWLRHHRDIFDHGIMIDYHSTDRSVEIIRELCPSWEIHTSRNPDFSPHPVDAEVMDFERPLEGWRVCLNATEFLFGNYARLDDDPTHRQIFAGQWMFVDMERREEPYYLNPELPLYHQRWWGYGIVNDFSKNQPYGSIPRAPRSIHNFSVNYAMVGRHYPQNAPTFDDLAIFYYGYASLEEASIKRKMQIQTQCPNGAAGSNHRFSLKELMDRFRKEQQPLSRDLREDIKVYVDAHQRWLTNKTQKVQETKENIQAAIATLNTALEQLN